MYLETAISFRREATSAPSSRMLSCVEGAVEMMTIIVMTIMTMTMATADCDRLGAQRARWPMPRTRALYDAASLYDGKGGSGPSIVAAADCTGTIPQR